MDGNSAMLDLVEVSILEPGITIVPADSIVEEDVAVFRVSGAKVGDLLTLHIEDMGAFEGRGSTYELRDIEQVFPFRLGPHQEEEFAIQVDFDEETIELWGWPLTEEEIPGRLVGNGDHQRVMRLVFDTGAPKK